MKSKYYNTGRRNICATGLLLASDCFLLNFSATASETDADAKEAVRPGIVSTLWAMPKTGGKVTLMTLQGDPITLTVLPETRIAGICVHCSMIMEIKVGQTAGNCAKCACSLSNAECFANKAAGKNGWADMLEALPKGTALLTEYAEAGKPESGLKRLTIDPKTALLPIKSAAVTSAEEMKAAAKAVGGTDVELDDNGKRLLIHLKNDWTQDKETRLARSLARIGVDIDFPAQEAGTK